jgi:hypothetical protein
MPRSFRDSAKPQALTEARVGLALLNSPKHDYGSISAFNKNQQLRLKIGVKMLCCICNIRISEICNDGAYQLDSLGRILPLCSEVSAHG